MSATLVSSGGEIRVRFPCDRCGKNMTAPLQSLGGLFRCAECGSATYMPSVPCQYAGCGGTYRRCGGVIQVLPAAPEELARRRAEADREIAALGPASPTDDYRDEVGEIRARIERDITRYRCTACGESHSRAAGSARDYESGTAKCARIVCGDCRRAPSADELAGRTEQHV